MLPNYVHKELDKTNRCFLWNKDSNYSPLMGWDKICKPKSLRGLGIRKASEMKKALQMKYILKILAEPNNCWARIIKEKYLKDSHCHGLWINGGTHHGSGPS